MLGRNKGELYCIVDSNGQYIVAGSDDGSFFMWEKKTTNIVRVLRGDDSIVNCLQPHPSYCMLATSGIDPVVRLWTPLPEVGPLFNRLFSKEPFKCYVTLIFWKFYTRSPAVTLTTLKRTPL